MAKKQTRRTISVSRVAYTTFKAKCDSDGVSMSGVVERWLREQCGLPPLGSKPEEREPEPVSAPVVRPPWRRPTPPEPKPVLPSTCALCGMRPPFEFQLIDGRRVAVCSKCAGVDVVIGAPCQFTYKGGQNVLDPTRCEKFSRFQVDMTKKDNWSPVCGQHANFWRRRQFPVKDIPRPGPRHSKALVKLAEPECPGPDCPMCSGEACEKCGAPGSGKACEHDTSERHGLNI